MPRTDPIDSAATAARGSVLEVLIAFLKLGFTSFGGPIAHLGYFRAEFVERRRWLDDRSYGDLVALCQFLPGPASIWGMAKSLCPDRLRAGVAIGAVLVVLAAPGASGQIAAIVLGGLIGRWALKLEHLPPATHQDYGIGRRTGALLLALLLVGLILLPLLAATQASPWLAASAVFYKAGALVFGGGHVVLPLLQSGVVPPGWVSNDAFLAGYGAAQAVPGPLFTFAAFLGAVMPAPLGGWAGGLALLVVLFLPAFLLVAGALPFWEAMRQRAGVQRAMGGINAAVVGVLGAALYDPVWTSAIQSRADFGLALAAFGLLVHARWSPVRVVALAAVAGWATAG